MNAFKLAYESKHVVLSVNGVAMLLDILVRCVGKIVSWPLARKTRWPRRPARTRRVGDGMASKRGMIPARKIEDAILLVRGEKVMLDADLARLYGVETRALVQAVKRNSARFPGDFAFQLTEAEHKAGLKSQFVISKGRGGRRTRPYAFTEQGVAMLSSVLHSERAILVNVEIIRIFVRLRKLLATHADLARKLDVLERKHDAQFKVVFDAIRQLMAPPPEPKRKPVGYLSEME